MQDQKVAATSTLSRRHFLRLLGGGAGTLAASSLLVACGSDNSGSEGSGSLKVSVGRQPYAGGNSPITQYMMDNDLFEQTAKKLGYDLTVEWRDYPSAQPQVEAMLGGNLDLGMWGNTPIVRAIADGHPVNVLNLGEGHLRFVIATKPDSGIRNFEDLKGKTIGAAFGADPYNVMSQMLLYNLGSGNPKDNNIKVVNTPTQTRAATVPKGMDAAIVIYPAFLKASKDSGTVAIANSFGYTEDHYRGPAGEGGGILLESVKDSPFYPDGYYLHRSFWVAHSDLIDNDPKVIVAFMAAQQKALEELSAMKPEEVAEMVRKYWELPPSLGAKIVKDEVIFSRNWVWSTNGDVGSISGLSEFMVDSDLIKQPLDWQLVVDNVSKAGPPQKKAYQRTGNTPALSEFTNEDAGDIRGLPAWQAEDWHKPGA